ncbi:ThuA domain-containing protein [Mariniblastus sp.]|nr:ThuA domain-containing protein [Mariniblastus sp.]
MFRRLNPIFAVFFWAALSFVSLTNGNELNVLFLGDNGHHQPRHRYEMLKPAMQAVGIKLTYTDDLNDLSSKNLSKYDTVLLYANIDNISKPHEKSLLDFVSKGGGFVPVHCATFCFRNSPELIALMGAQFQRHGTGTFRTEIEKTKHPLMEGFGGFESWDETYVHHLHNDENRTVLSYRVDREGREPWTWVKTFGQGRVFYTAWGHDYRTWRNPGFHNLVERGIRWSCKDDVKQVDDYLQEKPFPTPEMNPPRTDVAPFQFLEVGNKIPNYTPGENWGTQGQAKSKMQKPLAPKESLKHIVVPKGFHVELFASEPDIGGKPICMNWDARGRLWIAETQDYPNELQPKGKGRDRIRILEDTDGDGRADRFTVFAEGLSIPTAMAFSNGGLIVQDGAATKFLIDTNGDDVADESKVLFTGWSLGDTHGGVSNFQYGLDNHIWAMQGYNSSEPVANSEEGQRFRQGFFRFSPNGQELEFLRSTNNNTWGLGISEEGIIFGSTANGNPSVYMPIPNRYYEKVRGWTPSLVLGSIADTHKFAPITKNIRQVDWHGGYTAAAGHALYTAREYPREYWNRAAFVNGPTGHLVGTFVIKPDGTDFTSTSPFNLFASDDEWTAPIMAEVGPDGNVWVIDWYNYIVQHNPTPRGFETGKGNAYKSDLRDKKHGRIYRVVYGDKPPAQAINLDTATPKQLVNALTNPTMLVRKHAQRLLVERKQTDVIDSLIQLVHDQSVDEIGLNVGAIHGLWTLDGLGQFTGKNPAAEAALALALSHPSRGVRRNAIQVLPKTAKSTRQLLTLNLLNDPDAQVRLAALLSLCDLPPVKETGPALVDMWRQQARYQDRWIPDAFTAAAAANDSTFLQSVTRFDAANPDLLKIVRIVTEHYARAGDSLNLPQLITQLKNAEPRLLNAVVAGLSQGWPQDKPPTLGESLESNLKILVEKLAASDRGSLVKLAQSWGSIEFADYAAKVSKDLLARVDNSQLSLDERVTAAREAISFRPTDNETVSELLRRVNSQVEPALGVGIVESLALSQSKQVGPELTSKIRGLTPRIRRAAIAVLLRRPESTNSLLALIEDGNLLLSELTLEQKQMLNSHPVPKTRARAKTILEQGGALPNTDRQKVLLDMMPVTIMTGDATAGKAIFKEQCANCHKHNGAGAEIGPDLTGMAVHPKQELLTHIIDPSRDVEGNYRRYTVTTLDGLLINGLLAAESKTAIELYDEKGKKQVILREDIDELSGSTKSIMPEGFEKQINKQSMADLLEFLTQRGQFVPVSLRKIATICSDTPMFIGNGDAEKLIFKDWGMKSFKGVPFQLIDPQDGTVPNAIELFGPLGNVSRKMPKTVEFPCVGNIKAIHMLGGVGGWSYPYSRDETVSMIMRLKYNDGKTEDHQLINGQHFSDYINRTDVPKSEFAFAVRNQQLRYLSIIPQRNAPIQSIRLIKGADKTAPVTMAITLETK